MTQVEPQRSFRNLHGHGSVSDVWAEDSMHTQYNIEIQIAEDEDYLRRSRFIQSRIDSRIMNTGMKYKELPELYLIFITRKDFLKMETGVIQIVRVVKGTNRQIDNGVHEIYANLECLAENDTQVRLLSYFRDTDEKKVSVDGFCHLAERVRYLKKEKEGVRYMCALMEQERAEGMMEGRILGKVEVILGCLSEMGKVPDGLNRKLSEETDIVTLDRWVRLAARAQSIAVFEREM